MSVPDLLLVDARMTRESLRFAERAHEGALRRGTEHPYILHPISAALVAVAAKAGPVSTSACLLHDVIEDTDHTRLDIFDLAGVDVLAAVDAVTHALVPGSPPGEKVAAVLERLAADPSCGGVEKACDAIVNALDLCHDASERGVEHWDVLFSDVDAKIDSHLALMTGLASLLGGTHSDIARWLDEVGEQLEQARRGVFSETTTIYTPQVRAALRASSAYRRADDIRGPAAHRSVLLGLIIADLVADPDLVTAALLRADVAREARRVAQLDGLVSDRALHVADESLGGKGGLDDALLRFRNLSRDAQTLLAADTLLSLNSVALSGRQSLQSGNVQQVSMYRQTAERALTRAMPLPHALTRTPAQVRIAEAMILRITQVRRTLDVSARTSASARKV